MSIFKPLVFDELSAAVNTSRADGEENVRFRTLHVGHEDYNRGGVVRP
jgi:hypothetical protein